MNMSIIAASRLRGQVLEPNVFINGVGSQITVKEDLFPSGFFLSGSPNLVSNFKNNGEDVSFHYDGKLSGFSDGIQNVKSIFLLGDVLNTYFSTSLDGSSNTFKTFIATSNFVCNNEAFRNKNFLKRVYVPNLDNLGTTVGNNNVFLNTNEIELICNSNLSTINSGNPDGDIIDLINNRNGSVVYSTDKTSPSPTTISANTIGGTYVELNVSQPTHVNTLKYALVFVNGFFQDVYDINNVYAISLQEQTSYDIKVIIADEYFNISPYSNTINVTTTTTPALFQNAVAYYKLDETSGDAIDVVNGYNGTLFGGVTQGVAGKIGTAYSFDGSTGYIDYGNNPVSQFSDGNGNDIPFTIRMWINPNTIGNQWLFSKDGNSDRELIYRINSGGVIDVFFINGTTSNPFLNISFNAGIVTNTWQHLVLTYDGSKSSDGVKLYVNNTEINQSTGVQTFGGFVNGVNQLIFGYQQRSRGTYYDGEVDEQTIIKGEVWDLGKISDDYNNGNGTTI